MAVDHFSVSLQVWHISGCRPKPAEFLDQIVDSSSDFAKKRKTPNQRVDLLRIQRSEFADAEEPSEAFAAEFEQRLIAVADWIDKQPKALFGTLRKAGFSTDLLFTGWIDGDQMDLDLPPKLLAACGKLGLKISIITND